MAGRRRVVDEMFTEIRNSLMVIVAKTTDSDITKESLELLGKLNSYEILLHKPHEKHPIDELLLAFKDGSNTENMEHSK